jgi:hypothetical protein
LAQAFAESPGGVVTAVVSEPAAREAAFRFVENEAIEPFAIAEAHHEATARRCSTQRKVVVAVDQASLTITDKVGKRGFGSTGPVARSRRRRGLQVMNALVVAESGRVQGLLAQEWWSRDKKSPSWKHDRRPAAARESDLWRRALVSAERVLKAHAPQTRPWFQMDRAADYQAVLGHAVEHDLWITVRAAHDRALADGRRLRQTLRRSKILGSFEAPSRCHARGSTRLLVRARRLDLAISSSNGRRLTTLSLSCVHVREARARRGAAPIEWWLLTTAPVADFRDAVEVAQNYTQRWRVEELHKAWKSGVCNIEKSQLRSARAFMRWSTIAAAVAARAERLKTASRTAPHDDALVELSRAELDAAILLSHSRKHTVGAHLTLGEAVMLIANIGGYTGKSSGGPPGAQVIARGLQRVAAGAAVLEGLKK